jgi:hemerythrin superfamily protein
VSGADGEQRKAAFGRLARVLQAHETAEEAVIRPLTARIAGDKVAAARMAEEGEADEAIATLLELDVESTEFEDEFRKLHRAVDEHAEAEEREEFPSIEDSQSETERKELGKRFLDEFYAAGGGD